MLIYIDGIMMAIIAIISLFILGSGLFDKLVGWDLVTNTLSDFIITYADTSDSKKSKSSSSNKESSPAQPQPSAQPPKQPQPSTQQMQLPRK